LPVPSESEEEEVVNPTLLVLGNHKESAFNWQYRRHDEWTENYMLYRDKVIINRLTQRQSVNVPLMKMSIRTALKDIDDPPMLYFDNLDNNKDKEIFYNEYFEYCAEYNKLVIKDIVDKKQVFLYGRSFKKLNIVNGRFFFEILDPQDVLVDRYVDPSNLDSARYLCHQHIFRPVSSLEENENYDQAAVKKLKEYMATQAGLLKADENLQTVQDRNDRMRRMGVPDVDNPQLGETYAELNEHYLKRWDDKEKEDQYWLIVTAEGREILLEEKLETVIGKTVDHFWRYHLPFTSWGDDVERTDFWSDGMADTIRTPNKILNSWLSQMIENRTLRSFGMNFYDVTANKEFVPQVYEPEAFGWYPLPGKPADVYQRVDIPALTGSIEDMAFVMQLAEKATAATSIQQGVSEPRKITLGEVEILMANAQERIKSLSVFYVDNWKEFGLKYAKMLEAAGDLLDKVTLYKKGLWNDEMYPRDVESKDWRSKAGYTCKVLSRSEKDDEDSNVLQRMQGARADMPDNIPLIEIYRKRLLEFGKFTPDEIKQILDFERQRLNTLPMGGGELTGQPTLTAPPTLPQARPMLPAMIP